MLIVSQCRARRKDGRPCKAKAQPGKRVCIFHDPTMADAGHRARQEGGKSRTRRSIVLSREVPNRPLENERDAAHILGLIVNSVLRGDLDARRANAVTNAINVQLRLFDQLSTQERLTTIEAQFAEFRNSQKQNQESTINSQNFATHKKQNCEK